MTDLFTVAARLDRRALTDAIPPSVRRDVVAPGPARPDGDDLLVELDTWTPRAPARHLLPSIALCTTRPYGVRFELSARRDGTWSPWIGTATLGDAAFASIPDSSGGLRSDIDELRATPAVQAVRLRVRIGGEGRAAVLEAPWLVTLSAWDGRLDEAAPTSEGIPRASAASAREAVAGRSDTTGVSLAVPTRSQLVAPESVRLRICSPTSVGMAMEYHGLQVPTMTLADAIYHAPTDRYGVWPAAVRVAAMHGLGGYLLRFPGWDAAAWCLSRGLPIVASIRYAAGELSNAALRDTTGHLVVITGLDGADVLVNDPVAPPDSVSRRYDRGEFTRVWLERSGVGYVFFPLT